MIKYIFEDNIKAGPSVLYCAAYPKEIAQNFLYVEGSSNIQRGIGVCLSDSTTDAVIVFMDVIPDNARTVIIFNELLFLSQSPEYKGRLFIVPMFSIEYYIIATFWDTIVFQKQYSDVLLDCVNLKGYINSRLLDNEADRKYCTNFEKYCKTVIRKTGTYCANRRGKFGEYFYNNDCTCCNLSNVLKSRVFHMHLPCIPCGAPDGVPCDYYEYLDRFNTQFNTFSMTLKSEDINRTHVYKKLKIKQLVTV